MDELKTSSIRAENILEDKHYRTSLPVDQHFNWFQKMMWKWCFGVKVENYSEV